MGFHSLIFRVSGFVDIRCLGSDRSNERGRGRLHPFFSSLKRKRPVGNGNWRGRRGKVLISTADYAGEGFRLRAANNAKVVVELFSIGGVSRSGILFLEFKLQRGEKMAEFFPPPFN